MSLSPPAIAALFDQLALSYDEQPNPLLALEERVLPGLMPPMAGADVLDIGCGTGRWLNRFEALAPKTLTGTDCSSAMLGRARDKLGPDTVLYRSDASSLMEDDASRDLILASFVLSYVEDLAAIARACHRVLRPGGTLMLSDMHPETADERGWTRSFQSGGEHVHLPAMHRSLAEVVEVFSRSGLHLRERVEPAFDEPERPLFEQAGKLHQYEALIGIPAIYALRFQKEDASFDLHLMNAPWALDAWTWNDTELSTRQRRIAPWDDSLPTIDLGGYVLLPGLVNAHDHLEFALFPNLGRPLDEAPYRNATEWANEIHERHKDTIAEHLKVPLKTRLWWGAIRNLLCGVTTVCHHNPRHIEFNASSFPIHVVSEFGWSHSLAFASNLLEEYQRTPSHRPFLLHAAEGTDAASREEFYELSRLGLLDARTVLIHGLALGECEIDALNRYGSSLILCPTSNDFLFARMVPRELLGSMERVALGSDSPLTAAGDLLDEVQCFRVRQAIDAHTLFHMVTAQPAAMLHLEHGVGAIVPEGRADMIAVRDRGESPAGTLARLTFRDVELVLLEGVVQVASSSLYERLPEAHREGLELLLIEGHLRYVRAPIAELCRSAEQVLGHGALRLGRKEVRHVATA